MQQYNSILKVRYYGGGDTHGGWAGGTPILDIDSGGTPQPGEFRRGILSPNNAVYASTFAHEFSHIAMQASAQNSSWGESDAFLIQTAVAHELGASPWQVDRIAQTAEAFALSDLGGFYLGAFSNCIYTYLPKWRDRLANRLDLNDAAIQSVMNVILK